LKSKSKSIRFNANGLSGAAGQILVPDFAGLPFRYRLKADVYAPLRDAGFLSFFKIARVYPVFFQMQLEKWKIIEERFKT
jgi:hypothetical protein